MMSRSGHEKSFGGDEKLAMIGILYMSIYTVFKSFYIKYTNRCTRLSLQRLSSLLLDDSSLGLSLVQSLGQQLSVLSSGVSGLLSVLDLLSLHSSLSLQGLWGNQSLDLWSLGVGLVTLDNLTSDNEVSDVVLLGQAEELSNVAGSLWTQSLWGGGVSQTLDVTVTLLDNRQSKDSQVLADNATSDGLSLTLTSSSWSVTRVALGQQQLDSGWVHNTLLHWETLLVVTTSDSEDVALELVTDSVTGDFLTHSLLVEGTQLVLVIDVDGLLGTVGWVRNV